MFAAGFDETGTNPSPVGILFHQKPAKVSHKFVRTPYLLTLCVGTLPGCRLQTHKLNTTTSLQSPADPYSAHCDSIPHSMEFTHHWIASS